MLTAYYIVAIILFFVLYLKWGTNNKANIITKSLLLSMTVWGILCALFRRESCVDEKRKSY